MPVRGPQVDARGIQPLGELHRSRWRAWQRLSPAAAQSVQEQRQIALAKFAGSPLAADCEPQGTITVKGKGEMEVWHVFRRMPDGRPLGRPESEPMADAVPGR